MKRIVLFCIAGFIAFTALAIAAQDCREHGGVLAFAVTRLSPIGFACVQTVQPRTTR